MRNSGTAAARVKLESLESTNGELMTYIRVEFVPRGLWHIRLDRGCSTCGSCQSRINEHVDSSTHLEVIDMDVESATAVFGKRIGKFFVGFAQNSMLGIF